MSTLGLVALPAVQRGYAKAWRWMDAVMGVLLLALAGRSLFSR